MSERSKWQIFSGDRPFICSGRLGYSVTSPRIRGARFDVPSLKKEKEGEHAADAVRLAYYTV